MIWNWCYGFHSLKQKITQNDPNSLIMTIEDCHIKLISLNWIKPTMGSVSHKAFYLNVTTTRDLLQSGRLILILHPGSCIYVPVSVHYFSWNEILSQSIWCWRIFERIILHYKLFISKWLSTNIIIGHLNKKSLILSNGKHLICGCFKWSPFLGFHQ